MVSSWTNTQSSIFLELQKTNYLCSFNQQTQILLRFLQLTKQLDIQTLSQKSAKKTKQEKKICLSTRQRRISQNILHKKLHTRTPKHKNRIPPSILSRTKPHRNVLESHKKPSNKITIF